MSEPQQGSTAETIVFEFRDGPQAGHSIRSYQPGEAHSDAHMLWAMTRMGTAGRRFDWFAPDGTRHRYRVVGKREALGETVVTCEYDSSD